MGKIYLLFKTDDIKREVVAAHESLEVITEYLKRNTALAEPDRLGQGWEIDLLKYDDMGKSDLTLINKHTKELENCSPNDIHEGTCYNIAYKTKGIDVTRRILMAKCIKACPPDFSFDNNTDSGLHLHSNDIIVIAKCREDEDGDDRDRFQYYSYLYQWKVEHCNY